MLERQVAELKISNNSLNNLNAALTNKIAVNKPNMVTRFTNMVDDTPKLTGAGIDKEVLNELAEVLINKTIVSVYASQGVNINSNGRGGFSRQYRGRSNYANNNNRNGNSRNNPPNNNNNNNNGNHPYNNNTNEAGIDFAYSGINPNNNMNNNNGFNGNNVPNNNNNGTGSSGSGPYGNAGNSGF